MLRITDLTLARGTKRLLEGASLTVHAGHKAGLVGPNGCGKSSLFALILGEAHQDAGSIEIPSSWTIAHVAQETAAVATPAIEFVQDGDRALREIERALAAAELAATADPHGQGEALALLHHRFDDAGGYAARSRAATLLSGLGFPAAAQSSKDEITAGAGFAGDAGGGASRDPQPPATRPNNRNGTRYIRGWMIISLSLPPRSP